MKRVVTALVLVPIVLVVIFLGPSWLLKGVVAAMAVLCWVEYGGIAKGHGVDGLLVPGLVAGVLFLLMPTAPAWPLFALGAAVALSLSLGQADLTKSLPYAGALLLGVLYIFGAWRSGIALWSLTPHLLFFALAINWIGDTAAYYVGRSLGRRKLAPRVSPGKSWEGAAASLLTAAVFGAAYLHYALGWSVPFGLFLAALANFAGQVGDLSESALKRGAGIKDSGTLLPGHGGWLDRLDSSLFTMPVVQGVLTYWGA